MKKNDIADVMVVTFGDNWGRDVKVRTAGLSQLQTLLGAALEARANERLTFRVRFHFVPTTLGVLDDFSTTVATKRWINKKRPLVQRLAVADVLFTAKRSAQFSANVPPPADEEDGDKKESDE